MPWQSRLIKVVFGFAEHALFTWIATLTLAMTMVLNGGHSYSLKNTTPGFRRGLCRFRKEEKPETLLAEGTEQRPAEGGAALDVAHAAARTVVRATRRGTVVVVEHPRGRRDTTHFPTI